MSYNPSPPQLQYFAKSPRPLFERELLAPARRASVMMIVVGALSLLCGVCTGATILTHTRAELQAAMDANPFMKKPQGLPPGFDLVEMTRTIYKIISGVGVVVGSTLIVLGILIRRGNKAAVVFAVIALGLILLFDFSGAFIGLAIQDPVTFGTSCFGLLPSVLLGIAFGWLMQTLRNIPHLEEARRQWQTNYAAAQQQQQIYQQPPGYVVPVNPPQYGYGYGYGVPPVQGTASQQQPQDAPPVRHPPLPPDQLNPGEKPPQ